MLDVEKAPDATAMMPPDVAELWLLWGGDSFIGSIDDARDGRTVLACFSRDEALAAAKHQNELYDLDCFPVRVK
jgi:hypothetical protein